MLVLSRQRDQSVMIGDDTEVRVVDVRGDKVRLGFIAPRDVSVHRKEVYDEIKRENREAARVTPDDLKGMTPLKPTMRLVPAVAISKEDEAFLRAALDEAKAGLGEGGVPIGAVLVRGGQVIGRGRDRCRQHRDPTAHAEIEAFRHGGRQGTYADVTLYSTLMPCLLCAGAATEFRVKRIVIGESANYPGAAAADLLRARGVELIDVNDAESTELLAKFIHDNPGAWNGGAPT